MSAGSEVLEVYIGTHTKVARIVLLAQSQDQLSWYYESSWIENGFTVAPSLPLSGQISSQAVKNFLQNLLPEGQGLDDIVGQSRLSKNNVFGLIRIIGHETTGALTFRTPTMAIPESVFRKISEEELATRLARVKFGEPITYWDGKTRLSVAGVQDKLNLLQLNGNIGFGEGELCSNYIYKFETGKVPFIVVNECFTMLLANNSGIDVPQVNMCTIGSTKALVIKRFDRQYYKQKDEMLGIMKRRHVIDGCQACALPPSFKYERQFGDEGDGVYIRDGVSFEKLMSLEVEDRQAYLLKMIQWLTFNIVNGNYDAHGKNISFFVDKKGLTLAPFYDLVNIEALIQQVEMHGGTSSFGSSRSFAMSVGEYEQGTKGNFDHPITAFMLADFASCFDISLARMQLVMKQLLENIINHIERTFEQLRAYSLNDDEIVHVQLCIDVIRKNACALQSEVDQLPMMADLV